jgi:DNA-binding transcriptional regulator YiaG
MNSHKLDLPTSSEIKDLLKRSNLSRVEAALLMHTTKNTLNTWALPEESKTHTSINLAAWELLLLKTGEHPRYSLSKKNNDVPNNNLNMDD